MIMRLSFFKKKFINSFFYIILVQSFTAVLLYTAKKEVPEQEPRKAISIQEEQLNRISKAAEILFNPVISQTNKSANPFPTQSSQEALIDQFYGSKGLGVQSLVIRYIKNCYSISSYFEVPGSLMLIFLNLLHLQ